MKIYAYVNSCTDAAKSRLFLNIVTSGDNYIQYDGHKLFTLAVRDGEAGERALRAIRDTITALFLADGCFKQSSCAVRRAVRNKYTWRLRTPNDNAPVATLAAGCAALRPLKLIRDSFPRICSKNKIDHPWNVLIRELSHQRADAMSAVLLRIAAAVRDAVRDENYDHYAELALQSALRTRCGLGRADARYWIQAPLRQ